MKSSSARYADLVQTLQSLGSPKRAKASAWFFKTGKGEYGEGDQFLGIRVPEQRKVAYRYKDLSFFDLARLLKSPVHEHRFVALEILVKQYEDGGEQTKKDIASFYLAHAKRINNWDLVDTSASYILGDYLVSRNKSVLYALARSNNLWERRISIIATGAFIQRGFFDDTLKIAAILLKDKHDLIHKAVGWMLREVGKRNLAALEGFLKRHHRVMPRTMLRYAIERYPEPRRKAWLSGTAR